MNSVYLSFPEQKEKKLTLNQIYIVKGMIYLCLIDKLKASKLLQ